MKRLFGVVTTVVALALVIAGAALASGNGNGPNPAGAFTAVNSNGNATCVGPSLDVMPRVDNSGNPSGETASWFGAWEGHFHSGGDVIKDGGC
jgi:hypothetical protein